MIIKGLQKTTLLDFPGHVACTVFTGGCNFRCPFCHNASLAVRPSEVPEFSEEEFFKFLSKRKGILDGVCITGGEPLINKDIIPFIERIKALGFMVKLDTNGSYPQALSEILDRQLVDYVAMDVKNSREKYPITAGIDKDCSSVYQSIKMIMNSSVDYEFRTTVVKELHDVEDIEQIAKTVTGAERFYLQSFKDSGDLIGEGYTAHSAKTLEEMKNIALRYVKVCEIRGV